MSVSVLSCYLRLVVVGGGLVDGLAAVLLGLGEVHGTLVQLPHLELVEVVRLVLVVPRLVQLLLLLQGPLAQLFLLVLGARLVVQVLACTGKSSSAQIRIWNTWCNSAQ
jgi:hypothetical protein